MYYNNYKNYNKNYNHHENDPIYEVKFIRCRISYTEDWVNGVAKDVRIHNKMHEKLYFKTVPEYIKLYIEMIKESVIRKLKDLREVEIHMYTIDKNRISHRIIISLYNIISDILHVQKLDFCKNIFIEVLYCKKREFIGQLNFTEFV